MSEWKAPDVERSDDLYEGNEAEMTRWFLGFMRQTLLHKCAGLTAEQLKLRSAEPSTLSLIGLVRHLAEVERWWFRRYAAREDLQPIYCTPESEDADFEDIETCDPAADMQTFKDETQAADAAVSGMSLDEKIHGLGRREGQVMDLRWIYLHMLEEYGRHLGHADILRERIDGVTGE
jgi:uncharacterized damage-inducible protein DinB